VILGTLATALVQSSSTVTSVIVGLVAGGVPVDIAVPMIMGANMGTTITNTIVSLGNLRERAAFRKSFEAATVHDFFNLYSIVVFLPLEVLFHPLEKLGAALAAPLGGGAEASISGFNLVGAMTEPVSDFLVMAIAASLPGSAGALVTIAAGIAMIVASVLYLGKLLRAAMTGAAKELVDRAIGRGPALRDRFGHAGDRPRAVLVHHHQPGGAPGRCRSAHDAAGLSVYPRRQYRYLRDGAAGGDFHYRPQRVLRAADRPGPPAVQRLRRRPVHDRAGTPGPAGALSSAWLGARVEGNRSWAFGYIAAVFFLLPGVVLGVERLTSAERPVLPEDCDPAMAACAEAAVQRADMRLE
jgi:sodium-dependent phosphate cotransporter